MTDGVIQFPGDGLADPPALRTMPYNTEAEKGFLGGVFVENGATILEAVTPYLRPEHFAFEAHGRIFMAALKLHERGKVVDPVTLKSFFEADEILADIGGPAYLAELAASAVTVINAGEYARIIYDLWRRREIIAASEDIIRSLYDAGMTEETDAILERHEAALSALSGQDADKGGLVPVSGLIAPTMQAIEHAAASNETVGLTTGIGDLDRFTGGLMPSDLIVIAARPGMGKSALALTIAKANAAQGQHVGFFSLEMSAEQLMMRALAMQTGIAASDMRTGGVSDAQVGSIREAGQFFTDMPLMIDDRGGVSVSYIRHRAKDMRRKHGLDLLVVDYLGLVRPEERYRGNRVNEISEITAALKVLAKELSIPVVLLSQLNRGVEQRDNKRPQLSDLRDSGSIEQDADMVMLVFRKGYYTEMEGEPQALAGEEMEDYTERRDDWFNRRDEAQGKAEIIIAKQRMGDTRTVPVHFNGERTLFGDIHREERR